MFNLNPRGLPWEYLLSVSVLCEIAMEEYEILRLNFTDNFIDLDECFIIE